MIDTQGLKEQINETSIEAKNWKKGFTSDNPFVATGSLIFFSLWGVMTLMFTAINLPFTFFIQGLSNVLGVPPLAIGMLTLFLIVTVVFAMWRALGRNAE